MTLKALANEDTLLSTQMFPRLPARATDADTNFVSGTEKMFLILFRNILCPQQMFPSLRSPRNIMSNKVSATRCPRLPVPLELATRFPTLNTDYTVCTLFPALALCTGYIFPALFTGFSRALHRLAPVCAGCTLPSSLRTHQVTAGNTSAFAD